MSGVETSKSFGEETYLGDAVYAWFDGYQIWLRTGDGNDNRIALEPGVYAALRKYGDDIWGLAP